MAGLDQKLVASWLDASRDLGVRVIAPYTLRGESGQAVECEAYLPDFGSPSGAVVVSKQTERRERAKLRSISGLWCSVGAAGSRETLEDFEWFGPEGHEPPWCRRKSAWGRGSRG